MKRNFPESEICALAVAELRRLGWRVVCEVPIPSTATAADAVATMNDDLMTVEAKTSFTAHLVRQLYANKIYSDFSLAVVGSKPSKASIEKAKGCSLGLWSVRNGEIEKILEPPRHNNWWPVKDQLFQRALNMDEGAPGGMPQIAGVGPAISCLKAVEEYKKEHPGATWAQIYANVPNHYANARSMAGALSKSGRAKFKKLEARLQPSLDPAWSDSQ